MDAKTLKKNAIFVTKHGSHAYGLNGPTSDLDIKGALVGNEDNYFGFLNKVEQIEEMAAKGHPHDLVIYEITKFFKLAADCNPSIVEVLFTDESDWIFANAYGQHLVSIRDQFLSQKAFFTFTGYAHSQLKRLEGHARWMKSSPQPPKTREELGLPKNKNWIDIYKTNNVSERPPLPENYEELVVIEEKWREDSKQWAHYQEWLANRNPDRHALEAKHGYDTKHAMHLVRLLRMGEEILKTGRVLVKRPDREELLAIRHNGIWSIEQVIEYAKNKEIELREFYDSHKSPLPKEPNRTSLNTELCAMVKRYLGHGGVRFWDGVISFTCER